MKTTTKGRSISILLTLAVITAVIFAGPAQAITLGFAGIPSSREEGQEVSFQALIDIYEGEYIRADTNVTLNITKTGGSSYVCTFALDGTMLSDSCEYNVSLASESVDFTSVYGTQMNYLYGYGYGYNSGLTLSNETNFSIAPGYGYASGYGYSVRTNQLSGSAEFVYDINWTTAFDDAGSYTVDMYVMVNDGTNQVKYLNLDSNQGSFTITKADDDDGSGGDDDSSSTTGGDTPWVPPTGDDDDEGDDQEPANARVALDAEDVGILEASGDLITVVDNVVLGVGQESEWVFGEGSRHAGQRHQLKVKAIHYSESVAQRYVIVEVSSDPQNITVYQGQSVTVDLDMDGSYDVLLSANEITEDGVSLSVKELSERASAGLGSGKTVAQIVANQDSGSDDSGTTDDAADDTDTTDDTGMMDEPQGGLSGWWIALIVIVVVGAALYLFVIRKDKRQTDY